MTAQPATTDAPKELSLPEILSDEDTQERLGLKPLRFNLLAHQPACGEVPLTTGDVARVRLLLPGVSPGCRVGTAADVAQALAIAARGNSYHPVAEYLTEGTWDGEERIKRLASEVLHVDAADEAGATALLWHWLCLAATRGLSPGLRQKAGGMLVLVGEPEPAADPELFFRTLIPRSWYVDAPTRMAIDELRHHLREAWIICRSDLAALTPEASRWLVNHLQETDDPVDGPFAAPGERAPRTTLLVGVAEDLPPVADAALRRCIWPIAFGRRIDMELLLEWRDQLWLEVVTHLEAKDVRVLKPMEESQLRSWSATLRASDPWEDAVLDAYQALMGPYSCEGRRGAAPSIHEIQVQMKLGVGRDTLPIQKRIARILKANGMRMHRLQTKPFTRVWLRETPANVVAEVAVVAGSRGPNSHGA
jgi:predicted P-loop ATPase